MDLITISTTVKVFLESGIAFICGVVLLILTLLTLIGLITSETGEFKEYYDYAMTNISSYKRLIFGGVCVFLLASILSVIGSIPEIMLQRNITLAKLKYTSPEAISKIEGGALRVVDKLDKLIDKGIDSISKGE